LESAGSRATLSPDGFNTGELWSNRMPTVSTFDLYIERLERGDRLTPDEIRALAASPDILSLGMLGDTLRRRLHDRRVTFLRIAQFAFDGLAGASVPASAREVRLTGTPADVDTAAAAVEAARAMAGDRAVAGFSWIDVERWSAASSVGQVLARLQTAGLDAIANLPIDEIDDPAVAVQSLKDAGFGRLRLTIARAAADTRLDLLLRASALQEAYGVIQSLNPLPMALNALRPTTGYEDVKMVALARLAAPGVPSVQVDWPRYGPKLAQVALTFGADDIDGVSASDEAPEGRRRAPRAEIERNVEAAGFLPSERDGWFSLL
jgi:aminodeoxyfutalosine synthase